MALLEIHESAPSAAAWESLLLADPSRCHVEEYVRQGRCFLAYQDQCLAGVYVLVEKSPRIFELMNIAVTPELHGRGVGRELLAQAVAMARRFGADEIQVGTGNSSIGQLVFYQKAGFRIVGVERDYFLRNYEQKIVENGIRCADMIRLAMRLD